VYDAVGRRQRGINKAAAVRSSPAPPLKMRHGMHNGIEKSCQL
jgi:hypothetical protein